MSGTASLPARADARRFKPYPKYKDSGVEWLGEIPAHWTVTVLKRIGDLQAGAGFPEGEQGLLSEGIPFFKVGDMGSGGNEREMIGCPNTISTETAGRLRAFVFPTETIVFAKVGAALLLNRRRFLTQPSCIDNNMMGFMRGTCDHIWAFYWLCGLDLRDLANPGAVPSVNEGQMRDTPVVLPPEKEQRAIGAFLDRETARIDTLVSKKEQLIELLEEERAALITRAVTKGLDPSVPGKDSGVEWLDQYPAHWTGLPLKRWVSTKITDGPHETPELIAEGVDFISAEAVSNGRIDFDKRRGFISPDLHAYYCRKCRPVRDDILICKSGATTGKLARVDVDIEFSVWSPLAVVRSSRSRILPDFLEIALGSEYVQKQIQRTWSAGTQPNISMGDLEQLFVVAPRTEEQAKILAYLNQRAGSFEALAGRVHSAINRLKELRAALISAAVTGKIDVRGEAA